MNILQQQCRTPSRAGKTGKVSTGTSITEQESLGHALRRPS